MEKKSIGLIVIIYITTFIYTYGQTDSLIYTIPIPDLKWGLPNGILISPDNKYFLVSYDYNPSIVDFYELDGFKKLKRFKISGYTYLSYSFFYSDNKQVYIDIGKRINIGREKTQYFLFDLQTGERQKIKCDDGPYGCDYEISSPYRNDILREYLTFDNALLFKIENQRVNIYKK